MPAKLEEIREAVERTGKPRDQAYAIATTQYKKLVEKARKKRKDKHKAS